VNLGEGLLDKTKRKTKAKDRKEKFIEGKVEEFPPKTHDKRPVEKRDMNQVSALDEKLMD